MTAFAESILVRVVFSTMSPRQLAELIDRHGPALVLFARQWSSAPEDVVQESLLKLFLQRVPPSDPAAWLFRVVRNAAIDDAKKAARRKRREATAMPAAWFVEPIIDWLDAEQAVSALEQLSSELREVVIARLWGGLTFEQVAEAMGCSASSAHRRFDVGIEQLRKSLGVSCKNEASR